MILAALQDVAPPDPRWAFYGLLVTTLATLVVQLRGNHRATRTRDRTIRTLKGHGETLTDMSERLTIVAHRLDEHIADTTPHRQRRDPSQPVPIDERRKGTGR